MRYRYSIGGELRWTSYIRTMLITARNNALSYFVRPLDVPVRQCFVVGCGHSGTTLVAARLGKHPKIHLVPVETNCFVPINGIVEAKETAKVWVDKAGGSDALVVLEKTPKHVHVVGRVRKIFPEATIFGMFREPVNNCASLKRRFGDLEYSIDRWCTDNKVLLKEARKRRLYPVFYDFVAQKPDEAFEWMLRNLNLPFDHGILLDGSTPYDSVSHASHNMRIRQSQVRNPIQHDPDSWKETLGRWEVDLIKERTEDLYDQLLAIFREYRPECD